MSEPPEEAQVLLYQSADGSTRLEIRLSGDDIWLSLSQMADLFQRDKSVISRHLKNIFEERELDPAATVAKYATVQTEGSRTVSREIEYYALEAVIAVGYRVRSHRGTQFRIWATRVLREYAQKGFAMDDARLKQAGGGLYFDELLERIRDIRSSERVFWRKVLDIYATSIDYDPKTEESQEFFATIQNKMHWAIHGRTARSVTSTTPYHTERWRPAGPRSNRQTIPAPANTSPQTPPPVWGRRACLDEAGWAATKTRPAAVVAEYATTQAERVSVVA